MKTIYKKPLPLVLPLIVIGMVVLNVGMFWGEEGQKHKNDINPIPGISSEQKFVDLSITSNKEGLHLFWLNKELGLNYQKSTDGGTTWSNPFLISEYGHYNIKIVATEDEIFAFWPMGGISYRILRDGNWSPIFTVKPSPPGGTDFYSVGVDSEGTLHLFSSAFHGKGEIYYQSKLKGEPNWAEPVELTEGSEIPPDPPESTMINPPDFTSFVADRSLFLVWNSFCQFPVPINKHSKKFEIESSHFFRYSNDTGKTWSEISKIEITINDIPDAPNIYTPYFIKDIIASEPNIYFIVASDSGSDVNPFWGPLIGDDLYLLTSNDMGKNWNQPTRLVNNNLQAGSSLFPATLSLDFSGKVYASWIDNRHKGTKWWARLYFMGLVRPDGKTNPLDANNDIYIGRFTGTNLENEVRLTPESSYANLVNTIIYDDKLYVFWTGKRKVGNTLEEHGFPYEIFFSVVEIDE